MAAIERAVRHLARRAVLARFTRMLMIRHVRRMTGRVLMPMMRQAAHASASSRVRADRMRQQRERCAEERDNHENGLRTMHR